MLERYASGTFPQRFVGEPLEAFELTTSADMNMLTYDLPLRRFAYCAIRLLRRGGASGVRQAQDTTLLTALTCLSSAPTVQLSA